MPISAPCTRMHAALLHRIFEGERHHAVRTTEGEFSACRMLSKWQALYDKGVKVVGIFPGIVHTQISILKYLVSQHSEDLR